MSLHNKQPSAPEGFLGWLKHAVPTAAVMALLAGIGFWGHRTDWKFVNRSATHAKAADWCDIHSVAASRCVECNPDLMPKPPSFGWCGVHGVHDCPLEHPEIAQVQKPVRVTSADFARAERALRLRPRIENDPQSRRHQRRIQFASAEAVDKIGIEISPVWEQAMTEAITASGEIVYDQTRLARLSPRSAGIAWRVFKKIGDPVKRGEVLALVDAADVGKTKGEFLQALGQARLKAKARDDLAKVAEVASALFREAEAAAREADIRLLTAEQALVNLGLPVRARDYFKLTMEQAADALRFAGLPAAATNSLDPKTTTANLLPVVSPLDGEVLARESTVGEGVDPAKMMFVVADTRRMWLTLHVAPADARFLANSQTVRFRPDAGADDSTGKVDWISPAADEKTRTIRVRAEIANDKGQVRANSLGLGRIVLREEPNAVVVPSTAVQWDGGSHVVFVRDKNYLKPDAAKVFHARTVRVGTKDDANTEIIAGVLPGEVVASKGSGLLLKELLKNVSVK